MNNTILIGTVIFSVLAVFIGSVIYYFIYPAQEKNIHISVKIPFNSDCSIDAAISNFEILHGDEEQNVELGKL